MGRGVPCEPAFFSQMGNWRGQAKKRNVKQGEQTQKGDDKQKHLPSIHTYLQLKQPCRHGRGKIHRVTAGVRDGREGVSHADTVLEEAVDGEDGRRGAAAVSAVDEDLLTSADLARSAVVRCGVCGSSGGCADGYTFEQLVHKVDCTDLYLCPEDAGVV